MVPELSDLITLLSERMASGAISYNWGAYIYTKSSGTCSRDRPPARPCAPRPRCRPSSIEYVEFYFLRARPDVPGVRVGDLLGG